MAYKSNPLAESFLSLIEIMKVNAELVRTFGEESGYANILENNISPSTIGGTNLVRNIEKKSLWDYDKPKKPVQSSSLVPMIHNDLITRKLEDFPIMCGELKFKAERLREMNCVNNDAFYLKDDKTLLYVGKFNQRKIVIELKNEHNYKHNDLCEPVRCRYTVNGNTKLYDRRDMEVYYELKNNIEIYRYVVYLYNHSFYLGIALRRIKEIDAAGLPSPIWENNFEGTCDNCGNIKCKKSFTIKCYKPRCGLVTKYCDNCSVKRDRTCCNLWYIVANDYYRKKKNGTYNKDKRSDIERFALEVKRIFGLTDRCNSDKSSYFNRLTRFIMGS